MGLVQVHHLEQWCRTVDARDRLGLLLARLVRATLPLGTIKTLRFLHGVAIQLPGWDGEVDCTARNEYVVEGKSVWELGTGAAEAGKIRADFAKRADAGLPEGWDAQETVYVGVTLAKLQDADGIAAELAKGSRWKQVHIIDAVKLCHWLDLSAAVDTWAYEEVTGNSHGGMQSLSWAWRNWASITKPPIQVDLIAAARGPDLQRVQEAIVPGAGLQIDADSPDEAVAFIYAAVQRLDEPRRSELASRAILIVTLEAAARFPRQSQQLLILKGEATAHALRLEAEGHQVIRVHGRTARSRRQGLQLVRQSRREFAEALVAMGVPSESAEIDARACGSSPSVWRVWNLFNEGDAQGVLPEWAKANYLDLVAPVVLLGGWSEKNTRDIEVVEAVTARRYAELRDKLNELQGLGDPLMEFVADTVVVAAPATAFALIAGLIGREVLGRFTDQARAVFRVIDATLDVEPDQRMYARLGGSTTGHSEWLRDGMAETLLRMSVLGRPLEEAGVFGGKTSQQFVDDFVRSLPGLREDHRLLASLRGQLPVLAEAAPVPFMEALEALLQGDRNGLIRLFAETSDFGAALHPAILWGLETVAWDPRWLARAVSILGALDELDPGGRLSNRPAASIVDILLPWFPGTAATVQQKLGTLDALLDRYPIGGWKVLLQLLPGKRTSTSGTRRPEWKETGLPEGARIPRREVAQLYAEYVERAIARASGHVERLATLVDSYPNLSEKHRRQLETTIQDAIAATPNHDVLHPIWEALRDLIGRHRQFYDATWALEEETLQRLDELVEKTQPRDPLTRHMWLFSDQMPELPISLADHSEYDRELQRRRVAAIRELWQEGEGVDEVLELVRRSNYSGLVAAALAMVEKRQGVLTNLFAKTCSGSRAEEVFAMVLSGEGYKLFGDTWTTAVLNAAETCAENHKARAIALLGYPDSKELFTLVTTQGVDTEREFWARHDGVVRSEDKEATAYGVRQLVKHHRASDALIVIAHYKQDFARDEVLAILDATWKELNDGLKPRVSNSIAYWVEQVLEKLRKDPEVDRHALAAVEYKYLPLLVPGLEKKDLALHDILATDPSFFIQVLCDLYKPEDEGRDFDDRSPEERQGRAHHAWDLLRSWSKAPGVCTDGSLDTNALIRWVNDVRARARIAHRSLIADQQIGHILYHTPKDPNDNAWPHTGVRGLLEGLQSDDIETGIRIEQYNSRGTTSRAPMEGGKQERSLAAVWRGWSEVVGSRWPRTQALLIGVAELWEREAAREDVDAEKNRLRYQ